ncbi:hypothetical protein KCU93_g173, partial [Aureobasidium melanogenum]
MGEATGGRFHLGPSLRRLSSFPPVRPDLRVHVVCLSRATCFLLFANSILHEQSLCWLFRPSTSASGLCLKLTENNIVKVMSDIRRYETYWRSAFAGPIFKLQTNQCSAFHLWVSLSASRLGCKVESGLVMVDGNCASKSYELLFATPGSARVQRRRNWRLCMLLRFRRRTVATFAASAPRARTWRAVIPWLWSRNTLRMPRMRFRIPAMITTRQNAKPRCFLLLLELLRQAKTCIPNGIMRSVQQILAETASQTFRTTSTAAMEVSCNKKILVDEPRMNHCYRDTFHSLRSSWLFTKALRLRKYHVSPKR